MKDFESKTLYTDIIMEMLTSYMLASEGESEFLQEFLLKTLHEDEDVSGPGLFPGLLFSAIIHLNLMIVVIAAMAEEDPLDVLSKYGIHYGRIRPRLLELPQLHPDVVNKIAEMFE